MSDQGLNEDVARKLGWKPGEEGGRVPPDYSTDIKAALDILLSPRLAWSLTRNAKGVYILKMGAFINPDLSTTYVVTIETELDKLPEAICRAFLLSKARPTSK